MTHVLPTICCLLAATERVEHRITSGLVDGFSQWWQMPALVLAVAALAGFIIWMYRRDAAELPRGIGLLLASLRLGAVAALVAAYLDFERTAEHEIVFPSRVAVLVDSSASMTLRDDAADVGRAPSAEPQPEPATRAERAIDVLREGGLLAALAPRHEVSVWRFDADAEPIVVLPTAEAAASGAAPTTAFIEPGGDHAAPPAPRGEGEPSLPPDGPAADDWADRLTARGYETRLGEALARVLDQEPAGVLAGVIVLTDGANNAGIDPAAAVAALGKAGVPVFPLGIGSDRLPANVRVADVLVPARVFPGDRFAVTAYLQSQGLAGQTVRVELTELQADDAGDGRDQAAGSGRVIDAAEAVLGAGGELVAVRFDVPGLNSPGRRDLAVRVVPPASGRWPRSRWSTASRRCC